MPEDERRKLAPFEPAILTLARLSEIRSVNEFGSDSSDLRGFCRLGQFALVAGMPVDSAAEVDRLRKDVAKLKEEMLRQDSKLANQEFLARAPAPVVEAARARKAELSERLTRAQAELQRLEGP